MTIEVAQPADVEQERRERLDELKGELGPSGLAQFAPGTFGCHELLDRTSRLVHAIENELLEHPACIQDREWYALAQDAVSRLAALYQRIGERHLDAS